MRTVAVLPVKTFSRAKQRLSDAVGEHDRRDLAAAMVADVLDALAGVDGLEAVVVVTAEPLAVEAADAAGAVVVHDPEEAGQSAAAQRGIAAARELGAERVLAVPGDCPALDAGEVGALLASERGRGVVIVPDRHGSGTNALLLAPPEAIAPSFGVGSFARHAARARAAGVTIRIARLASLELDVDTPEDLAALHDALSASAGAHRTRAVLDGLPVGR
jgi:2-phospho-L-lactate/phosphoenolpyruvate guanylyltransferase